MFTRKSIKYLELHSNWTKQKQIKTHKKCKFFCSLSLYEILFPFPWISWKDFREKLSPFIHWKSEIFLQSLAITIAMTICGCLFLIPSVHDTYNLGYWASLTVAFVSDTHVGGTFHTSILRLEGTFLGVTAGFIVLQLQRQGMDEIYGIFILTLWVFICGYYRSHP